MWDHLVRLDKYIGKGMAANRWVTAIMFNLEKTYDLAWRYWILYDLYEMGLRGRLPEFVKTFMNDRYFQFRISDQLLSKQKQRIRFPQGSTLSVILIAVKINSLATVIPREIFSSLFVDDLIAYSDDTVKDMEMKLQSTVNRITVWANSNWFKFSIAKTKMMHFYKNVTPIILPTLKMAGTEISKSACARFLGMYWDTKLSWTSHIAKLTAKCMTDLNLLRSVSTEDWGAETEVVRLQSNQ